MKGVKHRIEIILSVEGVDWAEDSLLDEARIKHERLNFRH